MGFPCDQGIGDPGTARWHTKSANDASGLGSSKFLTSGTPARKLSAQRCSCDQADPRTAFAAQATNSGSRTMARKALHQSLGWGYSRWRRSNVR
jgi:hypothetical protein